MEIIKLYKCACGFMCSDKEITEQHESTCENFVAKKVYKKELPKWKKDYEVYKSLVETAKAEMQKDHEAYTKFCKYNKGWDYFLSLEKCYDYWVSDEGWHFCKTKRKGDNIDMKATLKKNIERNRVWAVGGVQSAFTMDIKNNPQEGDISVDGKKIFTSGRWVQK